MKKGWMYILECANGAYYTGSTNDLHRRMAQHQNGEGANFTRKHMPVKLVYYEEFQRIDQAFYREKQIQGWRRKKKEALILGFTGLLNELAECQNESHSKNRTLGSGGYDSAQPPVNGVERTGGYDSAQPPVNGVERTGGFDSAQPPVDGVERTQSDSIKIYQ